MVSPMPMPAFSVLRIDHVVLRVKDAERSIAFYRGVLGCAVEKRRDDLGLVHLRAGTSLIDLVTHDGPLGRQGGALPEARRMEAGRGRGAACSTQEGLSWYALTSVA